MSNPASEGLAKVFGLLALMFFLFLCLIFGAGFALGRKWSSLPSVKVETAPATSAR